MWTKEETDQLFELCERLDLRFIVIADRFPSSRTVEELKDRYYGGNLSFCWLSLVACCLYGFPLFIFYFISNYSLIEFQICSQCIVDIVWTRLQGLFWLLLMIIIPFIVQYPELFWSLGLHLLPMFQAILLLRWMLHCYNFEVLK